jgi:L-ribulose-5-phosphate 3-epimerase
MTAHASQIDHSGLLGRLCGTTVCYPTVQGDGFSLQRALDGIKAAGINYVELVSVPNYCEHFMPEHMSAKDAQELRWRVEAGGLIPVVANIAADLTTDAGVERLIKSLTLAPAMGIKTVVTHVEQTETEEGARAFFARVHRIVEATEKLQVRLALETHGGLCTTGADAINLVKRLGSAQVGVAYDSANVIYWGGVRPEDDLAAIADDIAPHVFHFHLKDKANMTTREYLFPSFGEGIVDFRQLMSMIAKSTYPGYLTLEVELDGYPSTPGLVDLAIGASRSHLEDLSQ